MAVKTENVYGNIIISDEVIGKIAATEATKCVGVVGMAFKSKADELASILKKDVANKGVKVIASGNTINLELHIVAEYGVNLNAISKNIVDGVKYAVESMTGFSVGKIVVQVESVRVSND